MTEHVHMHYTEELTQNTRSDPILVLTSILPDLVTLGINSGVVEKSKTES